MPATAILRIINVQVSSSSSIAVTFNYVLTSNLGPANISITSQTPNVPDSKALSVSVTGSTLTIICQPLTEFAAYSLAFMNTALNPFVSLNGVAQISQDGVSNTYLISGPIDPSNPVKNYLGAFYQGNIYNASDDTTVVSSYIDALSTNLARALYDIRQAQNENYLSVEIVDEVQVRGAGPFDRLNEEGAYEILRVGNGPTGTTAATTFVFADFPTYPVTLQREIVTEILKPNSVDAPGTFNINTFTMNLSHLPVTRVNSIVFTLLTAHPDYTYDIPVLGYQIQNSTYDQDYASSYAPLATSQIKLNEKVLSDPLFALDQIFNITVQYEYKNLGVVVGPTTVDVFTTKQSVREVVPPIINVFSLQHAPITDNSNNPATFHGVTFTDPNNNVPGALHPAFLYEIPYSLSALPTSPGQFSINYPTGMVYVYGADLNNTGTGPTPPLATYYYEYTFISEIDYVYDADSSDLVGLPFGSLINEAGTIGFSYEVVYVPGVDYNVELHNEELTERVNNNVIALNAVVAQNSPITNVFQIYNETSGEIYTLDRWYNNIIYFTYNVPPRISSEIGERASFAEITNELLFVNTTLTNSSTLSVFQMFLNNNTIVGGTEDGVATSFNTSMTFSDGNVFVAEKWFDPEESTTQNIDRLTSIGQYMVDYVNGVVYCAVSQTQGFDISSVSYKQNSIVPEFPHVISVADLYYRISPLLPKNKEFPYISFADSSIVPDGLMQLDELYLNNNSTAPYQIFNGAIGAFVGSSFLPGVTNQVKFVRSVFEYDDLLNSTAPLNFANVSTSSGFNINVGSLTGQAFESVLYNSANDGYYVNINLNLPYLSSFITYNFSVIRNRDSAQLWNSSGTIVPGSVLQLILPGINSPQAGDVVSVVYTFTINTPARVIIDYNKGDYFVDYNYVADNIIISYEWGDNALDFRSSNSISTNSQYYVSYRAGALRDALLKNFGTLVNIPELATFNVSYDRERYREALQAALSSFIQGPTVAAIKNIGQIISHVEPEVNESFLQGWALGSSLLNPEPITTTGTLQLLPAKSGNGVLVDSPDQTITFPVNDNIRFEEGTFETWITPQWNGLDNDAELTFSIFRDHHPIDSFRVFIGSSGYHPSLINGEITLDKNSNVSGTPNLNKDGVYIYYDSDPTGTYKRWYLQIIDGYDFGLSQPAAHYKFQITSSGRFYDMKSLTFPQPSNMSMFTGTNSFNMTIKRGGQFQEGVTFISDVEHFVLDFGKAHDKSRLSIYKDVSGFMNLRVIGQDGTLYTVSADVSDWILNQPHQVAAAWKLNTKNNRDEIHLFIDGFEVPNLLRLGQKLKPYLHENVSTVDPEEVVGLLHRDIVGSIDLVTTQGSNVVSSSINFSAYNIFVGDTIFINEQGFSSTGYTIDNINGQTLVLNSVMPLTLTSGQYSVNQTSFDVTTAINVVPNIAVSTIRALVEGTDLVTTAGSPVVSSSINFRALGVMPGFLIAINSPALDAETDGYQNGIYQIAIVDTNTLTLTDPISLSLSDTSFQVYSTTENELPGVRATRPDYSISQDSSFNNILTINNGAYAGDLILIRTLGLNYRSVRQRYYMWSNLQENVLKTQLPPPISLDEATIKKVILPAVNIGPSNPDVISIGNQFIYSNDGYFTQPSNSVVGRTLSILLNGNNVDFTTPAAVTITGTTMDGSVSETVSFEDYGFQYTTNQFTTISNIDGYVDVINSTKSAGLIEVKEKYSITHSESGELVPVVRFSYPIGYGYNLFTNGYMDGYQILTDASNLFSTLDIGNYVVITSPASAAGYYNIIGVSDDRHSVFATVTPTSPTLPLASFTGGIYQVLDISGYRTGFQNGFFTFEVNNPSIINTMVAGGSLGQTLPQSNIEVVSTDGFLSSGNIIVYTDTGAEAVAYTGISGNTFTGCFGGNGTMGTSGVTPLVSSPRDYYLGNGSYDLEYSTYLRIKMDPINSYAYVGSDLNGDNQLNGIINEMKIYSITLTDTRVGETALATQRTITKDFNSLTPLKADHNTLVLTTFNSQPFTNDAEWYVNTGGDGQHFQSNVAVNDNFGQSVVILDKPIVVPNAGVLNTQTQGTIEFWVNPLYDTGNDPTSRFYFDAYGATTTEAVSINNVSVKIPSLASQILSVTLKGGDPKIDYFAGGKLEIDTQRAVQEEGVSIGNSSVITTHPVFQVISVQIIGDLTGTDYFTTGVIGTNQQTIYLGKTLPQNGLPLLITYVASNNSNKTLNTQVIRLNRKLPYQNSSVIIRYVPKGLQGDRIAVYKDPAGYINFSITASGMDYVLRAPTYWSAGTWHRVKASYQINGGMGTDNMQLFIDGYKYTDVVFGSNIVFGPSPIVMGMVTIGGVDNVMGNIIFDDKINDLFIGNSYDSTGPAYCLMDNFRISNISRPIYAPYGEPLDVNYSSNHSMVFPVTKDLYTTYLMDFNVTPSINTSFTTIVNRYTGGFDFSVNILDSFGIVSSSPLVQETLEALINTLKPANSLAFIQYTE